MATLEITQGITFDSYEEAMESYYKTHQCDTDDSDVENDKIERWLESEGHTVNE